MSWRPLHMLRGADRHADIPCTRAEDIAPVMRSWVDGSRKAAAIALPDGTILYANAGARAVFLDAQLPRPVIDGIAETARTGLAQFVSLAVGPACGAARPLDGKRLFDVDVVPVFPVPQAAAPLYVISARETTLDVNLTNTLAESRRRFKDLVECSVDFAWESDAAGRFCYVSSQGALGFPAGWLDGAQTQILVPADGAAQDNPFLTKQPLDDVEVVLRDKGEQSVVVNICALPLYDEDGEWCGARGVCRDVTLVREHEETLREVRERDALLRTLITDIRDCVDPERMLPEAARLTARSVGATLCCIMRVGLGGRRAYSYDEGDGDALAHLQKFAARQLASLADNPAAPVHLMAQVSNRGLTMVAAPTRHNQAVNGVMCLARDDKAGGWMEKDRLLLEGVADYVGIAIAQTTLQEKLKLLARTDELTGLLNRRGLQEQVEPRMSALRRSKQYAALIYLDLDNFKQINDRYGHDRGDAVLRTLGIYLDGHTRGSDYCARVGGDEFVVWLDNTTQDGAEKRAAELLALSPDLQVIGGATPLPLSMSLGIVMTDPFDSEETLMALLDRADLAMYSVKRDGKSAFVVAPAAPIKKTG